MALRRNIERLPGGRYRVRKVVRGHAYDRQFSSAPAARLFLQHLELLGAGVAMLDGPDTISDLTSRYEARLVRLERSPQTIDYYRKVAKRLQAGLGAEAPPIVSQRQIDAYVDRRRAQGAGPATILKDLAALRAMLRAADLPIGWKKPELRPVRRHRRLPPDDEVAQLCTDADPAARRAVLLALLTGMRASEALALEWQDVDLAHGIIRVRMKKVAWEITVPIVATLAAELDVGGQGRVVTLDERQLDYKLRLVSRWSGVGICRHLVVTWLFDAGYVEGQIALLTGHISGITRRHYAHSSGSLTLKRQMLEAVENRLTLALQDLVQQRHSKSAQGPIRAVE